MLDRSSRIHGVSNSLKEPISEKERQTFSMGLIMGIWMRKASFAPAAPSTLAASSTSWGMDFSAPYMSSM